MTLKPTRTRARRETDAGAALIDAAQTIADIGQRVVRSGPEVTYASEKLSHALLTAAKAMALCGLPLKAVLRQAERGYDRGARRTGARP